MAERALRGFAAAPGLVAGRVVRFDLVAAGPLELVAEPDRAGEGKLALAALESCAARVEELAEELRAAGRDTEAEIVATGALMARDPDLAEEVSRLTREGRRAAPALLKASSLLASRLAALDDPLLAERADDVRSVGRRAAMAVTGTVGASAEGVVVADSLGPADVVELVAGVRGIVLAAGGVTAHAAIVARSLGIPMVVGAGPELLTVADGAPIVVDGTAGTAILDPAPARVAEAERDAARRRRARAEAVARREEPAVTRYGRHVRVLANATTAAEIAEALAQGAEGVGLLRTELLFLDAGEWPGADRHRRFLEPLLRQLGGRIATVRLLDFGGDKTPPFLTGTPKRGVELLLEAPPALRAQLRGILDAAAGAQVRILVPMVTRVEQLTAVREALAGELRGRPAPLLGPMIETPEAAEGADRIAACSDFLSLGTNDLTQLVLGFDRESAASSPTGHPAVLRLIERSISAAHRAGIPVEVCGEAASDPELVPILVGLGADELSVGAARVGEVRNLVRACDGPARATRPAS
ncbi:MAG TPA: putative PEP-binding protein [Candidatus Dormibacteraeota bacterium]